MRFFRKKKKEERKGVSLWKRAMSPLGKAVPLFRKGADPESLEDLEEQLIMADFGVQASLRLVEAIQRRAKKEGLTDGESLRSALADEIRAVFDPRSGEALKGAETPPTVYLVVGVNGAGKTTTIGKLARRLTEDGQKVLVAAGDTFRAGAVEQLGIWAERVGADFVGGKSGGDPAAVAFDALEAAVARGTDVVIVDTAGRLHTQSGLMEELAKVHRVIAKKLPGAPHEALLVLDATVGQNGLIQAREFSKVVDLTGVVLAKMDSTARGGIVVALQEELSLPVRMVGTGEGLDDLELFDVDDFVEGVMNGP